MLLTTQRSALAAAIMVTAGVLGLASAQGQQAVSAEGRAITERARDLGVPSVRPDHQLNERVLLHNTLAPSIGRARVRWHVQNPFRFFNDPADTGLHRAVWASLSDAQRQAPVLNAERLLSARFHRGWSAQRKGRVCWNPEARRFVCPNGDPYVTPHTHKIIAQLRDVPDAAQITCRWRIEPLDPKAGHAGSLKAVCAQPVELTIPYPSGARILVEIGGRVVAAEQVRVNDVLIVGLGDSFASGEGNPDFPVRFSRERASSYGNGTLSDTDPSTGYPTRAGRWRHMGDRRFMARGARWLDRACHRSLYSHQLRAALQLALEEPHRAVTFLGLACSGADIVRGLFLRYRGHEWVRNPPVHSQISAVAVAQCGTHEAPQQDLPEAYHLRGRIPALQGGLVLRKCPKSDARPVDLFMISIGGNDIGFARLVANAVLHSESTLKMLGGWIGEVHGAPEAMRALANLDDRFKALNRALHYLLHLPWSQSDRVLLTAYPAMALLDDGRTVCPDGSAGMDVVPTLRLSARQAREGEQAANRLHATMRRAARKHSWTFVEGHREQFLGRGICAGWSVNALSSVDDLRLPRRRAGRWQPYNPADYRPYASRQRWFRTPNDAFLTVNFHVPTPLVQRALKLDSVAWFQLLLAATYSGAFHPTAEGQAAIADAVVARARRVLAKYGPTPRR